MAAMMLLADSAPLQRLVAAGARGKDGLGFRVQGSLVDFFTIPIAFWHGSCISAFHANVMTRFVI